MSQLRITSTHLGARAYIYQLPTAITEYGEQLVRLLIEKVTAWEDEFTLEFESSVTAAE